jgi:hypothetical protein
MSREREEHADLFHATVSARTPDLIVRLLGDRDLDFGCRPAIRRGPDQGVQVELFATERKLAELRAIPGLTVTVTRNASEEGRRRQHEVGSGDRFEGGRIAPRGLGRQVRPDRQQ